MRLVSFALAAAATLAASVQAKGSSKKGASGNSPADGAPPHMARGGPLAAACEGLDEGAQCKIVHPKPPVHEGDDSDSDSMRHDSMEQDSVGICNKMLDGEMHCHILHPSALACLGKDEGTDCKFTHRGLDEEEAGKCEKMPHGMVCHPEGVGGEGPGQHEGARQHIERFAEACSDKSAGDSCSLDMPNGMENQFSGVCEEAHRGAPSSSSEKKRPLRCRMLSPMEAACIGLSTGAGCNITMHAHGAEVVEAGECKEAVRGELHCRHKPRDFGRDRPSRAGNTRDGKGGHKAPEGRSADALGKVRFRSRCAAVGRICEVAACLPGLHCHRGPFFRVLFFDFAHG